MTTTAIDHTVRHVPPRIGKTLASLLGLVLALVVLELGLRVAGRKPCRYREHASDVPVMHEFDAELGWQNKPGAYVFGRDQPIRMTFWPDRTRATAPRPREGTSFLALIGDSFTQGWAVSDEQTFGWKLQERFPETRVRNYGSSGYGTTQTLLALRALLAESGPRPQLVVYGFSDFHYGRNVALASWLRDLSEISNRGFVAVPYATLANDSTLVFHAPDGYPAWPLHSHSALVATLEYVWAQFAARDRTASAQDVTDALLIELDRVVRAHGSRLLVVSLSWLLPGSREHYMGLLAQHGIAAADCHHPDFPSLALGVPYYGHPNAAMNAHWASCIENAIRRTVPNFGLPAP